MTDRSALTDIDRVHEEGSYLFTVTDAFDLEEEVVLVPCLDDGSDGESQGADAAETEDSGEGETAATAVAGDDGRAVAAWINRCTHEAQRFDTGRGVPMRDNQIICPRHGSMFDACSGYCDNGDAADSTLPAVEIAVEDRTVYLTDEEYTFQHEGGIDDGDGPSSTSHIGF